MKSVYAVYKPTSVTPLAMVTQLKKQYPELQRVRVGYAGRLDPMADGVLLLLTGDENKNKAMYENLTKTYRIRVAFGYATDTYDCMGLADGPGAAAIHAHNITDVLPELTGTYDQPYPPYSAKTLNGVPLYRLARNNTLDPDTLPIKRVTVTSIRCMSFERMPKAAFFSDMYARIRALQGNFRQKEILSRWQSLSVEHSAETYPVAELGIAATSGTYMRSIAHNLGIRLRLPAFAYSITRTSVGEYTLDSAIRLPL